MAEVAILGAGAGGAAAAVDLAQRGHAVRVWARREASIAGFLEPLGVSHTGALGDGRARLVCATTNLTEALAGADVAVACLPAFALVQVARTLATMHETPPLVLNPGGVGGALVVAEAFRHARRARPAIAELSTLTYVARRLPSDVVDVSGVAKRVRAAALPGGEVALTLASNLFPVLAIERDVLATGLANVNAVLHPPGAILGAAWVEGTNGDYRFYADGTTAGVARVMAALDAERLAVARGFGHDLDPLAREMAAIGTASADAGSLREAVASGRFNAGIRAPSSLADRYYREDFGFGLQPLTILADAAKVPVPVAKSLLTIAASLLAGTPSEGGIDARTMGIAGLERDEILALVDRTGEGT